MDSARHVIKLIFKCNFLTQMTFCDMDCWMLLAMSSNAFETSFLGSNGTL
jgi:hypothetical protein